MKIIYYGNYATTDLNQLAFTEIANSGIDLQELQSYAQSNPGFVLFVNFAKEGDRYSPRILEFTQLMEEWKITTVIFYNVGSQWNNSRSEHHKPYQYVQEVYVEYFLWQCYHYLIEQKTQALNLHWNPDANKFLFLTGKYYKKNRAWLLQKIMNKGLLDVCNWSLFVDHYDLEHTISLIPGLSDQQFIDFCKSHHRNPDNVGVQYQKDPVDDSGYFSTHCNGFPFDPGMYSNARFRVISETWDQHKAVYDFFFTEKTWITILNRVPFMLASSPRMLYNLERLGFKTFAEYTRHPEYDFIVSDNIRYNTIVENAHHWMNHMSHKEQIEADIEHNYHRTVELADITKQQVQAVIEQHNLAGIDITDVLPITHWIPE